MDNGPCDDVSTKANLNKSPDVTNEPANDVVCVRYIPAPERVKPIPLGTIRLDPVAANVKAPVLVEDLCN